MIFIFIIVYDNNVRMVALIIVLFIVCWALKRNKIKLVAVVAKVLVLVSLKAKLESKVRAKELLSRAGIIPKIDPSLIHLSINHSLNAVLASHIVTKNLVDLFPSLDLATVSIRKMEERREQEGETVQDQGHDQYRRESLSKK